MRDNMTFNQLILLMDDIVRANMTGYHTDFFCYDAPRLNDCKHDSVFDFRWFVEETATHLLSVGDPVYDMVRCASALEYRITYSDATKYKIERIYHENDLGKL